RAHFTGVGRGGPYSSPHEAVAAVLRRGIVPTSHVLQGWMLVENASDDRGHGDRDIVAQFHLQGALHGLEPGKDGGLDREMDVAGALLALARCSASYGVFCHACVTPSHAGGCLSCSNLSWYSLGSATF